MAVANGYGKVVTSGSVFMYDVGDTVNSYIGEPTTNYIWHQNPRIDTSYESYMPEAGSGTITQNHPGAIRVYNQNGSDISYYLNTGVGDWTNQRHAYWVYDSILARPVVRMYNQNGSWQSKYHNPGIGSFSNIGISAGTKYVISWLQYVESLDRSAYVGYYSYSNTYGYNNFWDGLQAAYNTKTYTWQRVYAIFTATNNGQLGNYHGGYMYGHSVGSGELRIADVQLEVKTHPTQYSNSYTRSSTQGLLPIVSNSTIDLSNTSFDSNAQLIFDGTDDRILLSNFTNKPTTAITCETIIKPTRPSVGTGTIRGGAISSTNSMYLGIIDSVDGGNTFAMHWANQTVSSRVYNWNGQIPNNAYSYLVGTYDGITARAYLNGIEIWSTSQTGNIPDAEYYIGTYGGNPVDGVHNFNGYIPVAKIYNRALSALEVKQNYNKYKTRFNLP
jgi:hypothetical protein